MSSITVEEKIRVINSAKSIGIKKCSEIFGYHRNTISNWIKLYHLGGSLNLEREPRVVDHPHSISKDLEQLIVELKISNHSITNVDIYRKINQRCSITTIISKLKSRGEVVFYP